MVLGGLFKLMIAGVLAWAWFNGHLASIAARATGLVGGSAAPAATGLVGGSAAPAATSSTSPSSSTGSVA